VLPGPQGAIQVYRISPGIPRGYGPGYALKFTLTRAGAYLWKSVGKGVRFNYLEGDTPPSWLLETERDAGLSCMRAGHSIVAGV